jgi:GEVED domain/Bacterial Ig domain/Secretion system C-terminal sorting domain
MTKHFYAHKRFILALQFLCFYNLINAQSWQTLRDQGANFYDIKAAFHRQYGNKVAEMNRELRKEVSKKTVKSDKFEQQMEGMVQYMRWANFVEPRVKESNGDMSVMGTSMVQALRDQSRRSVATRTGASWSVIGPRNTPTGGGNGRINAVRAHPSVAGTLFACAPAGGLWKSTDSGGSWTPISDAIAVLGATDVAFDPTDNNIMYLATGDGEAGDAFSTGVYKSTDGGSTWAVTGLSLATSAKLRISKLLVNSMDNSILACGSLGIYRSTNGGGAWTQVSTASVRDLETKPGTPNTIYAGCYYVASTSTNPMLRSTDGGATWAAAGTGLPTTNWQRVAVGVTALDATYVYALVSNTADDGLRGLYLSTDGGTTFTSKATTPNILGWNASGNDAGGQGWYDLSLAVDPSVKTTIYAGGVNMWKSTTSGTSWSCVGHWSGTGAPYVHADIHDLTFIGSTLYVGNDGGVFTTANGGSTWTDKSSNLAIGQLYGIGISQTNPNMIISGHQDNGTNYTSNLTSWSQINGGDGMLCFIDRTNNNTLFSSIYNGDLYRSTDGGANFTNIYTVSGGGWVTPWMQDPVTATTLYAGGRNVVRSTNNGTSWTTISSFSLDTLISIDVATTNNQNIIAASKNFVMKTINGGTAWTNITNNLPSGAIKFVYFDPNDATKIYATITSYLGQSVYYSANGGTSWANLSSGLPSVPANCLVIQKNNGDMYCGTDIGVYLLPAGKTTWQPFTNGMPGIIVTDLEIYTATGKLRAATFARGIWETTVNSNNNPPVVNITLPVNNAVFSVGSNVVINATATDADGTVTKVEFYQGATLLNTTTTSPYTYTWPTPSVGSYALTAKAYDDLNAIGTSSVVNITVAIAEDAGVSGITTPNGSVATANVTPSVILKNFGTTTLTGTTISYKVDNNAFTDFVWTGSLVSGATATVALPAVTGYALGAHTFTAKTGLVNGNADGNTVNDAFTTNFTYALCAPTYVDGCSNGVDVITRLQLGNLDNISGTECGTGNYNFYSTATVPNLAQSVAQSLTLTMGNDATQFVGAWIDYNQNGTFETSEYLGGNSVTTGANGVYTINFTIPAGATLGETRLRVRGGDDVALTSAQACGASSDPFGQTEDYRVNIVASSVCNSPLSNTTMASVSSVCAGETVSLALQNSTTNTGITYQWQSSTDGTNWTNISGKTNAATTQVVSVATSFRCALVCSGGAPSYSTTVQITMKAAVACPCKPTGACTTAFINTVSITNSTLNNAASGCTNSTGAPSSYIQYPVATATATLTRQSVYALNVTTSTAQIVSVWIDYNQNGTFETTEWAQVATATAANTPSTVSLTIPATAATGLTLMRIRSRSTGSANNSGNACTTFASGETEDYWVTIAAVIPVEMKFVMAYPKGESNHIDWMTASENSVKAFIVERSLDSKEWTKISTNEPKGGAKETYYSITDNQPLPLSYYRVRTVDLDGSEEVSKIVSVKRFDAKKLAVLSVVPVPTTEGVSVDFSINKDAAVTLVLTNVMGQIVKTTSVNASEGSNKVRFEMNDLPNGTYLLTLSDGETQVVKRVVKQ